MTDPFSEHDSEKQLLREAKVGLSFLMFAIVAVGGWCYSYYAKYSHQIPAHIVNAPVAHHVGPDYYLRKLHQENPVRTFDYPDSQVAQSTPAAQPSQPIVAQAKQIPRNPFATESAALRPARNFPTRTARLDSQPIITKPNPRPPASSDISKNDFASRIDLQRKTVISNSITDDVKTDANAKTSTTVGNKEPIATEAASAVVPASFEEIETRLLPEIVQAPKTLKSPDRMDSNSFQKPINPFQLPIKEATPAKLDGDPQQFHPRSTPASDEEEQFQPQRQTKIGEYRTKSGDSFWGIAQQVYDDGRLFRALYEHNRDIASDFESLATGTILITPGSETLCSLYPNLCPSDLVNNADGPAYRTAAGDTLFDIARQSTGQASRYLDILKLNRNRLPADVNHLTRLPSGLNLQLPE